MGSNSSIRFYKSNQFKQHHNIVAYIEGGVINVVGWVHGGKTGRDYRHGVGTIPDVFGGIPNHCILLKLELVLYGRHQHRHRPVPGSKHLYSIVVIIITIIITVINITIIINYYCCYYCRYCHCYYYYYYYYLL